MVLSWFNDFDITMIAIAADIMKENIPEPKLSYINSILKKWKKSNIKTPADVEREQAEFEKAKAEKESRSKIQTSFQASRHLTLNKSSVTH